MRTCGGDIAVYQVFFRLSIHALIPKIWPNRVLRWCQNGDFLRPVFPACRMQHISDMHSEFAQGHTMCGSMVDIQSVAAEIRREKKIERKKKKKMIETTGQKYNGLPYYIGWP